MNWSQSRAFQRSRINNVNKNVSKFQPYEQYETFSKFETPGSIKHSPLSCQKRKQSAQCLYHLSLKSHVCLSCKKSICLRCAITLCSTHDTCPQELILPALKTELMRLWVEPKKEALQIKISHLSDRQQFFNQKFTKLIQDIENDFGQIVHQLNRKKNQVVQYVRQNYFMNLNRCDEMAQIMHQRLNFLKSIEPQQYSIQKIEEVAKQVQRIMTENKIDQQMIQMLMGCEKTGKGKLWNDNMLENVLFEIENIFFKTNEKMNRNIKDNQDLSQKKYRGKKANIR